MLFELYEFILELFEKVKKFSFKTKWRVSLHTQAGAIYVHRKRFFDKQWRIIHTEKVIKR